MRASGRRSTIIAMADEVCSRPPVLRWAFASGQVRHRRMRPGSGWLRLECAAVAAKAADRPVAWRRNIDVIRRHIHTAGGEDGTPVNMQLARTMYERARHEGLA